MIDSDIQHHYEDIPVPESSFKAEPETAEEDAIVVPPEKLEEETLRHLAVEFLLREAGNDISEAGITEERVERVLSALRRGTHLITFDPKTESVGIIDAATQKMPRATR